MSISSQQILWDKTLVSGNRYVLYEFTDHVSKTHQRGPKLVGSSFDADADLLAMVSVVEAQLEEGEHDQLRQKIVEDGANSLDVVQNDPVHSTSKKLAKFLIYWMMDLRRSQCVVKVVLALKDLLLYVHDTLTQNQVENWLDISSAQYTKMKTKIAAILKDNTHTVEENVATAEANSEEW